MAAHSYKVFISHATEDRERFVLDFARRLREHGVDAWVDAWELLPGDSLVDRIFEEGIKNAHAMIVILSRNSIEKPWVREELNAGFLKRLSGKCRVIPVIIDECEVPEALRSTVWQRVSDLGDYEEEFERILDSIYGRTRRPPLGEPPAQLRRQRLIDDLAAGRVPASDTPDARQDLEGLILDKYEPPLLRLQALVHYLNLETRSGTVLMGLLADPDPQVRRTVLQSLHKNPRRDLLELFDASNVGQILADPDQEVAVASTRLACDLVEAGILPAEVLTGVNRHSYWLVRRIAIECIIKSGDPKTLELLHEFRTTSYHVSQQLMRDYIESRYDAFDDDQRTLAIDLLRNLATAKRASRTSKSKTENLIEKLLLQ
ncbi:MAG: TIR domain-containing protein [Chloroflexi bacterium]|nr:TIR domain-containing protein [Chloroflexota bacterium]